MVNPKSEYLKKYRRSSEQARLKYQKLNKEWYERHPTHGMWRNAKKRSKDLGLDFDLVRDEIIVPASCPLLGIPLIFGKGKLTDNSPSIDRINPSGSYTKDNTWVVSFRANSIKRNSTIEEFETILKNWKEKLGKPTS